MAENNEHSSGAAQTEPGGIDVAQLESRRYEAMLGADTDALAALLADELVYTHSDGSQDNKAEYLQKVADGSYHYRSIDHGVSQVVRAGDAVLVRGWMRTDVDVNGVARSLDTMSLAIWCLGSEPRLIAYASTAIRRA